MKPAPTITVHGRTEAPVRTATVLVYALLRIVERRRRAPRPVQGRLGL